MAIYHDHLALFLEVEDDEWMDGWIIDEWQQNVNQNKQAVTFSGNTAVLALLIRNPPD